MKKASDYRRMARISMAGQLGTMAAAGVMKSLVLSAAVLVLVTFLAVSITGAGAAAAVGGLPVGFAEAGLILWAIFVALLILAALALSCLLNGGIVYQARKATWGEDISIRDLGYGLKAQVAWKLIVIELIAFLVNLLFKVPYWAALILQRLLATMYPAGAGLFLLQGLIGAAAFLWLYVSGVIVFLFLGLSAYTLMDRPELGPLQCVGESLRLTRRHRWKLFCLNLSFTGWWILGAMSGGIGLLWITPYFLCTVYHFYDDLRAGL